MAEQIKDIKDITINLVSTSGDMIYRFESLVNYSGVIYSDYLDENEFMNLPGGLELIMDSHFIFFQSYDYRDLSCSVDFLLKTLLSLNVFKESDFQMNGINVFEKAKKVNLYNTNGDYLSFNNFNQVKLSYTKKSDEVIIRNNFYFDNFIIDEKLWINSCAIALNEYFFVFKNIILKKFPSEYSNGVLKSYLELWERLQLRKMF